MRKIGCINYMLTTDCDRMCPDCCCNIPAKEPTYVTWEYLLESAKYLKDVRINLSGGEPTLHPNFVEWVPKLRDVFEGCILTIETNGWGVRKFPEVFKYFDWVQITHYTEKLYAGSWDNKEDVDFITEYLDIPVYVSEVGHMPRSRRVDADSCVKAFTETVSYEKGLLYPCCVGPGVEGSTGIVLTPDWREEILKVPMPCKTCFFSGT